MVENNSIVCNQFLKGILAPICGSPPKIWNANITRSQTFDYFGQQILYQCDPGFEIPLVLLEEVNVTEPVREPFGVFEL